MSDLYRVTPHFVPRPIGWGPMKDEHKLEVDTWFILFDFIRFRPNTLPSPDLLAQRVKELHFHPGSVSPTGQFGYPIQTFDGALSQSVAWDPSWPSFFAKLLRTAAQHDTARNGPWAALERLLARTVSHLIPRLLGALEDVTPVLIHGDMWDGNIGVDRVTGQLYVFDCAAYYAHNEMEIGIWYAARHKLSYGGYIDAYLGQVGRAEPRRECLDRIRLYSAKTNLMFSACTGNESGRWL